MTAFLQTLIDAAALGSLYALVALAIGLVFGIMRLINFAQSEYIMYGAYGLIVPSAAATPVLLVGAWPILPMLIVILTFTMLLALATERIAFRPLRDAGAETLMISSFALSHFLQHVAMAIYSTRSKSVPFQNWLGEPVIVAGLRIPLIQIITPSVTFLLLGLLVVMLRYSGFGIQIRAAAENYQMARLLGVRGNVVIAGSFAISGLIGGIVAVLLVAQTGSLDIFMGVLPVIYAFFATVVGGMGSLTGAVVGGFFVGMISQLLQAYLPADVRGFRDAFLFALVILVLLFRPAGLFPASRVGHRV